MHEILNSEFLQLCANRQRELHGTNLTSAERNRLIIEYISHAAEELFEARMEIPRKNWKSESEDFSRERFACELFDVIAFIGAIIAYADISAEEFNALALHKLKYNSERVDHISK